VHGLWLGGGSAAAGGRDRHYNASACLGARPHSHMRTDRGSTHHKAAAMTQDELGPTVLGRPLFQNVRAGCWRPG
jgi:hypothetical protein